MKNLKFLFVINILLLGFSSNAQDTIILKPLVISAKVIKISETEIEYKLLTNIDGPSYIISLDKVDLVKYKNGSIDYFSTNINLQNSGNLSQISVNSNQTEAVIDIKNKDTNSLAEEGISKNNIKCNSEFQFLGTLLNISCPFPPCKKYILSIKTNTNHYLNLYITVNFKIDKEKGVYYTEKELANLDFESLKRLSCFDKSVLNKTYTFCCKKDDETCGDQPNIKAYYCEEMFSE